MTKKPIIGITATRNETCLPPKRYELWTAYVAAVIAGGGIPFILPDGDGIIDVEACLDPIDGLLLSGGPDIMPTEYRQEPLDGFPVRMEMTPERDAFELRITRAALNRNMPIFGICRGHQLLAIATKGSLYQDLSLIDDGQRRIRHYQTAPYGQCTHEVEVVGETLLSSIVGSGGLAVNSLHHQAIDALPPCFCTSALSSDGVVEAVESVEHDFVLGVQWHPEQLFEHDERQRKLFIALSEAAVRYRECRGGK